MDIKRASNGHRMGTPWASNGHSMCTRWATHGNPEGYCPEQSRIEAIYFKSTLFSCMPNKSPRHPIGNPWATLGYTIATQWAYRGYPMHIPCKFLGYPVDSRCASHTTHPMGIPLASRYQTGISLASHGHLVRIPWASRAHPIGIPRASHRLLWASWANPMGTPWACHGYPAGIQFIVLLAFRGNRMGYRGLPTGYFEVIPPTYDRTTRSCVHGDK